MNEIIKDIKINKNIRGDRSKHIEFIGIDFASDNDKTVITYSNGQSEVVENE